MFPRGLSLYVLIGLLAACAPGPSTASPAPVLQQPAAASTATLQVEPPSYATSLLVARWDSELRHYLLAPVDPATGQRIPGYAPVDLGVNYYHAFSPDRKTLAILTYADDSVIDPVLHIIDLDGWKAKPFQLHMRGWNSALVFSPDGSSLAVVCVERESSLLVFSLVQEAVTAQTQTKLNVSRLQFTRDGTGLMAYGTVLAEPSTENLHNEGPARVVLFDARDFGSHWSAELEGVRDGLYPTDENKTENLHQPGNSIYLYPGVVFDPREDLLYAVHADEERLTAVDFAKRSAKTIDIRPELSWFEQFLMLGVQVAHAKAANGTSRQAVISPDGEFIYTVGTRYEIQTQTNGDWQSTSTPLGFEAIRVADGGMLREKDTLASSLRIAPDGRIFLYGWAEDNPYGGPSTDILDPNSFEFSQHYAGAELLPARRMDGSRVLVSATTVGTSGEATRMTIHDYSTGELMAEWISPKYAGWLSSP